MRIHLTLLICCLVNLVTGMIPKHVEILNQSGAKLQVFWINPDTGEQVPFSSVHSGAHLTVDTYVNHTFVLRQTRDETMDSRIRYMKVTDDDDQVVYVKENLEIKYTDLHYVAQLNNSTSVASALTKSCLENLSADSLSNANETIDALLACYEERLTEIFKEKNEEISYEDKARKRIGAMLENYTCADYDLPTTRAIEERKWGYNDTLYDVHILHEKPDSQIHLVKAFITPDECEAFQQAATQSLHRGTVANGNGGHRLSENRKAWQAGVHVPWEKEATGDHIAAYARRMYSYANYASGYGMDVIGQEDIMSIQYFGQDGEHPSGSTFTPEAPDRYMPHCDSECSGLPHKQGARVATMVAYCTIPKKGGATNFQNAGVHVKPEQGAAAFFSYMNPETKDMDSGWTTHSGCPVIEGTKRIVVHWMRVGVSQDEPWDSFNTLNIPKRLLEDS